MVLEPAWIAVGEIHMSLHDGPRVRPVGTARLRLASAAGPFARPAAGTGRLVPEPTRVTGRVVTGPAQIVQKARPTRAACPGRQTSTAPATAYGGAVTPSAD